MGVATERMGAKGRCGRVGDRGGVRVGELGGLERRGGMGGQQRKVE